MSRNQLDQSNTTYLLLHKDNPVHWYPWGPEAFAEAEATGKPILLSIGYSSCHWCHVMNAESYSDPETAALMNEHFINIKVDRDERPDVDLIYQSATATTGTQGGWPLNAFLTPKGVPYFMGAYFPNEDRGGQRAFKKLLADMSRVYRENPDQIALNADKVPQQLNEVWNRDSRGPLNIAILDNSALRIGQKYDVFYGGLIGPQKFPQPHMMELLFRAYLRNGISQFHQLTATTLDYVLLASLYDHVGGGFFRYATDERWTIPHFEKLTADNALLIDFTLLFWQNKGNTLCQTRIEDSVGWLLREMKVEDAFGTSLDSNSEGEEGRYYTWTEAEIDAALAGTFSQKFKAAFGISREGTLRGRNILRRTATQAPFPQGEADEALFAKQCGMLLAARQKRPAPMRDDQILADVNGIVITALANAGAAMRRNEWVTAAIKAFDFIVKALGDGNLLYHSWRAGKRGHVAFSDDYAHMARAALALWEATGDKRFLEQAKRWVHTLNEDFWDALGDGYYFTSHSGRSPDGPSTDDLRSKPTTSQ
ncbi:MAG: thioredoxin domain-containing protein [Rhizomicrobium sp.]